MKFRKPFASFPTKGRVKKVSALLKDSALTDRLILTGERSAVTAAELLAPIDWNQVEEKVGARVTVSTEFLKQALGA